MKVIINGAGIAGPTLAYWLSRSGHEVLLVEAAPSLRTGGYIIDFGLVGYDVAEKMGLIPRIQELGYQVKELRFVDRHGHKRGGNSTDIFRRLLHDRFTSLRRSDLAATIYGALGRGVETIFGDSVAGIEEAGTCVRVRFDHTSPREVDLVIGADGLHSRVRQLAFGPDAGVEVSLGYHVAAFEVEGYRPRDELVYLGYGVPGRQIFRFSMRDDKTLFLFVFRDEYLPIGAPTSEEECKAALAHAFADVGWECPGILAALPGVRDYYFDRASQIRMERWTKGRTALVGDAAACVSLLAGEGAGLAMAEAYVLAGELRTCRGDHAAAFARYQERLMSFLRRKQATAAKFASALAPRTTFGITFRNLVTRLMGLPLVVDFFSAAFCREKSTCLTTGSSAADTAGAIMARIVSVVEAGRGESKRAPSTPSGEQSDAGSGRSQPLTDPKSFAQSADVRQLPPPERENDE
jgi:2-polyprenyl-6-methoxyphenol hydroxylase-like FAD-dependent oxidoreductase